MDLSANMPTHPNVNMKRVSTHSLCHFTQACALPHHLSRLLTTTFERFLNMGGRQTPSTEPTAGREQDDGYASFKTRIFLQKKGSFDARGDVGDVGGGGRGRRNSGLMCSSDSVKAWGEK